MNPLITFFKDFKETEKPYHRTLEEAIKRIREGKSAAKVKAVQLENDTNKRRELKKTLPCVLFSGQFSKRQDSAIMEHSGLICLDFDHLTNAYKFRDDMAKHPFVVAAFLSPSYVGVKVLVRIPAKASQHRGHFAALKKLFPSVDDSGKNESRICYECHDKDVYFNPNAEEFTGYEVPMQAPPAPVLTGAVKVDYRKMNVCVDMVRAAIDGEKNTTLLKAARLAGGYIASGYFAEEAVIAALESEIAARPGVANFAHAQQTIRDGIRYGKTAPLYDRETTLYDKGQTNVAPKTTAQNGIITAASLTDQMLHGFRNGKARGETTHFNSLNKHFTWKLGDFTLFSGLPNSGKSEFVYQLALAKALYDGWRSVVFSPENFPADEFYDTLIHALVGKSVDPRFPNQMSEKEYLAAINFISDRFYFVYPDSKHTIEEVECNFEYAIREYGCKIVLADPYNQLSRVVERDDQFLDSFLTNRKRFALNHNIAYTMTAHPRVMHKDKDSEDYREVDIYDLAGGAMWSNKVDNFIVVHRPFQSSEPQRTEVDIIIRKIKKQKLVGIPGKVSWSFDRLTNRYSQPLHGSPLNITFNPDEYLKPGELPTAPKVISVVPVSDPGPPEVRQNHFPAGASSWIDTMPSIEPNRMTEEALPF